MTKRVQQALAFGFGITLVVILLLLAVAFPTPTPFQYTIFRVSLALASAGVAAMFPGFLQVTIADWQRAGGALAVFVLVYFYNPAALVSREPIPPEEVPETIVLVVDEKGDRIDMSPGDVCPLNNELLYNAIPTVEIRPSVFDKIEKKGLQERVYVTLINDLHQTKWMRGQIFRLAPKLERQDNVVLLREHCVIAMGKKSRVALGLPGELGNADSSIRKGHKIRVILSSDWAPLSQ